jgi:hypothetical protein
MMTSAISPTKPRVLETPEGKTDPYERRLNEPETLGDEKGRFEGEVPIRAILESEVARHPRIRSEKGVQDARKTGDPHDPFSEERISDEPRYDKSERATDD